tara:strand:- start:419 stop:745 length:327 start_codon:yes stop_codon:yes gene_type:complete
MKKSELRTGMIVETIIGSKYYVSLNGMNGDTLLNIKNTRYIPLSNICSKLNAIHNIESSIAKVYAPKFNMFSSNISDFDLVWERKEKVKEYTMNELIKKVGHEFKIKK